MSSHTSTTTRVAGDAERTPPDASPHQHQPKVSTNTHTIGFEVEDDTMTKLKHKVDMRIIPIAISIYLFNFLDKVSFNVSNAEMPLKTTF